MAIRPIAIFFALSANLYGGGMAWADAGECARIASVAAKEYPFLKIVEVRQIAPQDQKVPGEQCVVSALVRLSGDGRILVKSQENSGAPPVSTPSGQDLPDGMKPTGTK